MKIKPYPWRSSSKKVQVEEMFDRVSTRYDLLNRLLSLGIDTYWRRFGVSLLRSYGAFRVLDVATGTADLAISVAKRTGSRVVGIDLSESMLKQAQAKIDKKRLGGLVSLERMDAESLRFDDNSFDVVVCAFGVRNFGDLSVGLKEMHRVLRSGGLCLVIEFSMPRMYLMRFLFGLYFNFLLPLLGRLLSRDANAYRYLPASVRVFAQGSAFLSILGGLGFTQTNVHRLTLGICSIYTATKP